MRHAKAHAATRGPAPSAAPAIGEVVARQEAHGLPVLTDGEFRRLVALLGELPAPSRQSRSGRAALERAEDAAVVNHIAPATARLQLLRNVPLDEYRFVRALTSRRDADRPR